MDSMRVVVVASAVLASVGFLAHQIQKARAKRRKALLTPGGFRWWKNHNIRQGSICVLRSARSDESDMRTLLTMIRGLAEHLDAKLHVQGLDIKRLLEDFRSGAFHALIAEVPGIGGVQPAGAAIFFESYSTWDGRAIFLEDFFVLPEYRGRGIGNLLLRTLSEIALAEGFSRLQWESLRSNTAANGYYKEYVHAHQVSDRYGWKLDHDGMEKFTDKVQDAFR